MNQSEIYQLIKEKKLKKFTRKQLYELDSKRINFVQLRHKLNSLADFGFLKKEYIMKVNSKMIIYHVV